MNWNWGFIWRLLLGAIVLVVIGPFTWPAVWTILGMVYVGWLWRYTHQHLGELSWIAHAIFGVATGLVLMNSVGQYIDNRLQPYSARTWAAFQRSKISEDINRASENITPTAEVRDLHLGALLKLGQKIGQDEKANVRGLVRRLYNGEITDAEYLTELNKAVDNEIHYREKIREVARKNVDRPAPAAKEPASPLVPLLVGGLALVGVGALLYWRKLPMRWPVAAIGTLLLVGAVLWWVAPQEVRAGIQDRFTGLTGNGVEASVVPSGNIFAPRQVVPTRSSEPRGEVIGKITLQPGEWADWNPQVFRGSRYQGWFLNFDGPPGTRKYYEDRTDYPVNEELSHWKRGRVRFMNPTAGGTVLAIAFPPGSDHTFVPRRKEEAPTSETYSSGGGPYDMGFAPPGEFEVHGKTTFRHFEKPFTLKSLSPGLELQIGTELAVPIPEGAELHLRQGSYPVNILGNGKVDLRPTN